MVKAYFGAGTRADIDAANSTPRNSSGYTLEVVDERVFVFGFGLDIDLPCMCSHKCSLCL